MGPKDAPRGRTASYPWLCVTCPDGSRRSGESYPLATEIGFLVNIREEASCNVECCWEQQWLQLAEYVMRCFIFLCALAGSPIAPCVSLRSTGVLLSRSLRACSENRLHDKVVIMWHATRYESTRGSLTRSEKTGSLFGNFFSFQF